MHISYVACMHNAECSHISQICAMLTVAENAENADCDPLTPSPTGVITRNAFVKTLTIITHKMESFHLLFREGREKEHSPVTLVSLAELMLIDHAGNVHKRDKFPSFPTFDSQLSPELLCKPVIIRRI